MQPKFLSFPSSRKAPSMDHGVGQSSSFWHRRKRRRGRAAVAAASVAMLVGGCAGPELVLDAPRMPSTPRGESFFFGEDTIWRTPVPPDVAIDPMSDAYVARFAELGTPVVAVGNFTVPIYRAEANAPRFRVDPTADYATAEATLDRVPIPDHARPDPEDDGHMAVLDVTSDCVFEMYRAARTPNGWTAEWINATPADGSGVYPDGLSTRASGLSITAGLIWPEELRAGRIDHALVFAYPFTRDGDPVAPATRGDGQSKNDPTSLPIGAHLVLDPTLDLAAIDLSPAEFAIAEALQRYGMILADTNGGAPSLFAVHPQSYPTDPYKAIWGSEIYVGLSSIPFDRMKVLSLGAPQPAYRGPVQPNRCTDAVRDTP